MVQPCALQAWHYRAWSFGVAEAVAHLAPAANHTRCAGAHPGSAVRGIDAAGRARLHAVPQGPAADVPPHKLLPARWAELFGVCGVAVETAAAAGAALPPLPSLVCWFPAAWRIRSALIKTVCDCSSCRPVHRQLDSQDQQQRAPTEHGDADGGRHGGLPALGQQAG